MIIPEAQMKIGIYFAYWEHEWAGDYHAYIDRTADLGFDVLELSCAGLPGTDDELRSLAWHARDRGLTLTAGYGPAGDADLSSPEAATVQRGLDRFAELFRKLELLNIGVIGGGLYSYWPVDYSQPFDKQRRWDTSVRNIRRAAAVAADHGVTLCMETLNRFEGYLINTAAECRRFVLETGCSNVGIMLDTFHMNIEEDSFRDAIICSGGLLKHVHLGEANRRVPGKGRLPWREIGAALNEIHYDGACVMEPFVMPGGTIGREIRVWRELEEDTSPRALDRDARQSLGFVRAAFAAEQPE